MEDNKNHAVTAWKVRKPEYDLIRIIAIIQVIILHTTESGFLKSLCSGCVIMFVMLSGSLKLRETKEFSWRKWAYSLARIIVVFLITSLLYTILVDEISDIKQALIKVVVGYYHLWFLYMIFGLYLCIPIILSIKKDRRVYRLFAVISLITAIIVPTIVHRTGIEGVGYVVDELIVLKIGLGYVFYYILGDLLSEREYRIGTAGLFAVIAVTAKWWSYQTGAGAGDYDIGQVLYVGSCFTVLVILGRLLSGNDRFCGVLAYISGQCFVVYLVHAAVIEYLRRAGIQGSSYMFLLTLLISFVFAILFNSIATFLKNKWRHLYAD